LEAVLLLILGAENTYPQSARFSPLAAPRGGKATRPARAFAGTHPSGYNAEASCI